MLNFTNYWGAIPLFLLDTSNSQHLLQLLSDKYNIKFCKGFNGYISLLLSEIKSLSFILFPLLQQNLNI